MLFAAVVVPCVGASVTSAQPSMIPPGMIEACKSLPDGSPCQFEVAGKVIDGICSPLPNTELACRPGSKAKRAKAKPQ